MFALLIQCYFCTTTYFLLTVLKAYRIISIKGAMARFGKAKLVAKFGTKASFAKSFQNLTHQWILPPQGWANMIEPSSSMPLWCIYIPKIPFLVSNEGSTTDICTLQEDNFWLQPKPNTTHQQHGLFTMRVVIYGLLAQISFLVLLHWQQNLQLAWMTQMVFIPEYLSSHSLLRQCPIYTKSYVT
ncbi:uncharacterized protein LOC130765163 [Actinidia eriantha]|uniref:uncharacterized protein LOC130765163 n=1 Tax=Actinidia eriantha TaxID=165200 RepID=UPI00258DD8E3|nr:uncharacterized protein LOC130765163 [Actinidia eriantha]